MNKNALTASALAFAAALWAASAAAATITVNSFLDNGVNCTLRKAIQNANAGSAVHAACTAGTPGSNTIVLGTGTYLFETVNGTAPGAINQFDLVNNSITIQGNGPANTVIDGQNKDFMFDNFDGTTAITITLSGLTVTRATSEGPSGYDFAGMYISSDATLILNNVAFTNNFTSTSGAAIWFEGTGTITNSTFSGNTSAGEGGAIRSIGPLTITNSTFTGNSATSGGALYHAGSAPETLNITNSTFSGNTATTRGGAIAANAGPAGAGAITLTHVTIANNTVTSGSGGGIYKNQDGAFNIDRSIIANNTAGTGPNCNATSSFNSLNYNVFNNLAGCTLSGTTTNNFEGTVTLNALANNGGTTQTISLPAYSPARDRAPTCATSTDQRGTSRPIGLACDSGAFEASATVPQPPNIGVASAGNGQATVPFTFTGSNGGATIIDFRATSNPGGIIGTSTTSPITVSGLTNGTSYTFTVTARNSVGSSAASAASNSVTPIGPPGAPIIGTATAGNTQVSVAFSAPTSNGGSPITGYTATCGGASNSGPAPPIVVSGLANGVSVTCTVKAINAYGAGPASLPSNSVTPTAPTPPPHSGFNGDARSDVFWRDSTNGLNYQWQMNGLTISGQGHMLSVPTNWAVAGTGDVNGDGIADVLWREGGSGLNYLWMMNGLTVASQGFLPTVPNPWIVVGMGDASGDGRADVFWRDPATGLNYLWIMNGLTIGSQGYLPSVSGPDWEVVGVADYSGDGKADVLWRNKTTGQNHVWVMDGLVVSSQGYLTTIASSDWEVVGSPDANGDGKADVLWRNKVTGQNYLWIMNGLAIASQGYLPSVADANWKVVGYGDYNGDGKGDVLWRNATTGANYLWTLSGISIATQGPLLNVVGANWQPVK